jgi:hypothetical protein
MNITRFFYQMAQFWSNGYGHYNHFLRVPAEYIQQISLSGNAWLRYQPVIDYVWKGPHPFNQWFRCNIYCREGNFYFESNIFTSLTLEQAQIYYEHYSQLASSGEWAKFNNGVYTLDKWTVSPTQLFYDGAPIKTQINTVQNLFDMLVTPDDDMDYFDILALSIALSELW